VASEELRAMLANVNKGQGTLGRLIVDPSIYDDLKLILGNVERSAALKFLVRYAISNKENKKE
jgi:phospholipid/cholesterol/gamma-HCH transport system substrate-binding protein